MIDDDEEEPADGPDPEPLALPDALPVALVDESLPISKLLHHLGYLQHVFLNATGQVWVMPI